MNESNKIKCVLCFILVLIVCSRELLGVKKFDSNQKSMTLQEKRMVLKSCPISESKIQKQSGFSVIEMKGNTDVRAVVMGDGKAPVDWALGGTVSTYNIGNKLLGSIGARVRAKFFIANVVDKATISLSVIRDGNTPMLLTPINKDITTTGAYTLEVLKEFSLEPNHTYKAQAVIEVGQPQSNQVRAVAGVVVKVEWIY